MEIVPQVLIRRVATDQLCIAQRTNIKGLKRRSATRGAIVPRSRGLKPHSYLHLALRGEPSAVTLTYFGGVISLAHNEFIERIADRTYPPHICGDS